jgi:hypothetical protein
MITHTPNIELPNMRPNASPGVIEVRVTEASQLDPSLDAAVELIKEAATQHGTGIMITRLGPATTSSEHIQRFRMGSSANNAYDGLLTVSANRTQQKLKA